MPVGRAPHKTIEPEPGGEVRLELCRLAVEGDELLEAWRHELDREGPSYTVDTLRALRDELPGEELFFLAGGDQAETLGAWKEPEQVLRLATLAVAERDAHRRERITSAIALVTGSESVSFFEMPAIEVSSSLVRERVREGRPFRHLVAAGVADQIESAGLYARQEVRT